MDRIYLHPDLYHFKLKILIEMIAILNVIVGLYSFF